MLTHWSYIFLALTHRCVKSTLIPFTENIKQHQHMIINLFMNCHITSCKATIFLDSNFHHSSSTSQVFNTPNAVRFHGISSEPFWKYFQENKFLLCYKELWHFNDVIMGAMASQLTSLTNVYSTVYSVADQRQHQSSASLAFVRGIHPGPVNSRHKRPVTRKMFPYLMTSSWNV